MGTIKITKLFLINSASGEDPRSLLTKPSKANEAEVYPGCTRLVTRIYGLLNLNGLSTISK